MRVELLHGLICLLCTMWVQLIFRTLLLLILVITTMTAPCPIYLRHSQLLVHLLLNTVNYLYIIFSTNPWYCCLILKIYFTQTKLMKLLPFPSFLHLLKPVINFLVYSKFLELLHFSSILRVSYKTCRFAHGIECMDSSYLAYL